MNVVSVGGLSLGRISNVGSGSFVVEKGSYFPKDHELDAAGIAEIRGNDVVYRLGQEPSSSPVRETEGVTRRERAGGEVVKEEVLVKRVVHEEKRPDAPTVRHEELKVEKFTRKV